MQCNITVTRLKKATSGQWSLVHPANIKRELSQARARVIQSLRRRRTIFNGGGGGLQLEGSDSRRREAISGGGERL